MVKELKLLKSPSIKNKVIKLDHLTAMMRLLTFALQNNNG
jgi:hypothetical protein